MIAPEPSGILKLSSNGMGTNSIIMAVRAPAKETVSGKSGKLMATMIHTANPEKKPSQLLFPTLCFPKFWPINPAVVSPRLIKIKAMIATGFEKSIIEVNAPIKTHVAPVSFPSNSWPLSILLNRELKRDLIHPILFRKISTNKNRHVNTVNNITISHFSCIKNKYPNGMIRLKK